MTDMTPHASYRKRTGVSAHFVLLLVAITYMIGMAVGGYYIDHSRDPAYTIEEAGWTRISKEENGPLMAINFHGVAAEEEAMIVLGFGKPDKNGQGRMYYRLATADEREAWEVQNDNLITNMVDGVATNDAATYGQTYGGTTKFSLAEETIESEDRDD